VSNLIRRVTTYTTAALFGVTGANIVAPSSVSSEGRTCISTDDRTRSYMDEDLSAGTHRFNILSSDVVRAIVRACEHPDSKTVVRVRKLGQGTINLQMQRTVPGGSYGLSATTVLSPSGTLSLVGVTDIGVRMDLAGQNGVLKPVYELTANRSTDWQLNVDTPLSSKAGSTEFDLSKDQSTAIVWGADSVIQAADRGVAIEP
jgi:hypothetical protein